MLALGLLVVCTPATAQVVETGDVTDLKVAGLEWVRPIAMHAGIWMDVSACSGLTADMTAVSWAVADSIVDLSTDMRAYGATVMGYWDTVVILIERPFWLHPTVLSHEILHALGAVEGALVFDRCTMRLHADLPLRAR
jgi:hypothetical protein